MKIYGLQKMTLLDFPGHVACTVFLNGCDFRCPYCHNFELAEGKAKAVMEEEDLLAFLKKRTGLLEGVAFTGGEPCLHRKLPELLRKVRSLGFATKLDTNGNHPDLLAYILNQGLVDYVAMDIKNSPEKYGLTVGMTKLTSENTELTSGMTGRGISGSDAGMTERGISGSDAGMTERGISGSDAGMTERGISGSDAGMTGQEASGPDAFDLSPVRKSISLLMNSSVDYEFRTTVVKELHEEEDFVKIGEMIRGAERYFLQSFTDRDSVPFGGLHAPSPEELACYLDIVSASVREASLRGAG